MPPEGQRHFNLPYHQSDSYWLCALVDHPAPPQALAQALAEHGMKKVADQPMTFAVKAGQNWADTWKSLRAVIAQHGMLAKAEAAIIASVDIPGMSEITLNRKSIEAVDTIADSLWLGPAILADSIRCHMQPVLDKHGKTFGHEAFARLVEANGETVSGGRIFAASRAMNIEHMVDRILHVQAIKTFVESDLHGFLFVNFVPGFIHRPEKYLEGLTEAAQGYQMPSKNIVLDFTKAETPRDALHLRSIFDYCRSKGYSIALDDINSVMMATRLIQVIRPDFLKLDMDLVQNAHQAINQLTIRELVALAHQGGCSVIAEGVETVEIHKILLDANVDLFQGYLFSPPVAASPRKKVS